MPAPKTMSQSLYGETNTRPVRPANSRAMASALSQLAPRTSTSTPRASIRFFLTSATVSGRKSLSPIPSSREAWLMARPWFPVEADTTPLARSPGDSDRSLLRAPLSLNDPVVWSHSHLAWTSAPHSRLSASERSTGVRRMSPLIRS